MIEIDKEALYELLILDNSELTQAHFDELNKLVKIMLIKWWSNYIDLYDEIVSQVTTVVLERKGRYNPKLDAYNYLFTMLRNEVGNYIKKVTKEVPEMDFSAYKADAGLVEFQEELNIPLSKEVVRFIPYLTGEQGFTVVRIPRSVVLPLMTFLLRYELGNKVSLENIYKQIIEDLLD